MTEAEPADLVAIYATFPDIETAEATGSELVEMRLAACANILPAMRSIYRWNGAIERDDEVVAIVKTRRALVDAVTAAIVARHPYDTPAVVAFPIVAGAEAYLDWVRAETADGHR